MNRPLLALITLCSITLLQAEDSANIFSDAKFSGELRMGFVSQNNDSGTDNEDIALGGSFGIETKEVYNTTAAVKFYTTNGLNSIDSQGTGLFSSDNENYSILGEAYIKSSFKNTNLKIGRQKLDTPYTNDNDIRMIPNTFEAIKIKNTDITNTTLLALYITRSAGVDSPTPEEFSKVVPNADATMIFGVTYEDTPSTSISAWYNEIDGLSSIAHFEGKKKIKFTETINLSLGAQFANYAEQDGSLADGDMYGLNTSLEIDKIKLYAGYNSVSNDTGKSVTNFFGGGRPFMTSMDTLTLNGLNNVKAYRLGVYYSILENLNLSYYYGNFEYGQSSEKIYTEDDIFLKYTASDKLSALLIYTNVNHSISGTTVQADSYNRIRGSINFIF